MANEDAVRELMARLMEAVEASLAGSAPVREALEALAREGYEPKLFFVANAGDDGDGPDEDGEEGSDGDADADAEESSRLGLDMSARWSLRSRPPAGDGDARDEDEPPTADLTSLDRDFLRSVRIRSDDA
jgi:hypothetical protein